MKVSLVGMGPGSPALLTRAATAALARAELFIGAPRLLEPYRRGSVPCREAVLARDILAALEQSGAENAAVLLSGDTGFYSGAKGLRPLLLEAGMKVETFPGVSSLQYLCAKIGTPWEDIHPASAHGRGCAPAELVARHGRVFFLTGETGDQTPRALCAALEQAGWGKARAWVGSRLSYPNEEIFSGAVEEFSRRDFPPLSVLLVQGEPACPPAGTFGIPDSGFVRGQVPMTKEEVRAAALSKLRVAPGGTYWDVGAGTGSVSVAISALARDGRVLAVERDPEACGLILENAARFGAGNLTLVQGEAPAALGDLPAPDGVFVGGSGGSLEDILKTALEKNPCVRVVVAAVTLETLSRGAALLDALPFAGVEVSQITVARARELGRYHLMTGQNPVFLLSGEGQGKEGTP